jgi:hypothetical protein
MTMRKWAISTIFCGAAALLAGTQSGCETPTRTGEENAYRYNRFTEWEVKMLAEDVERFIMLDHETRLTRWKFR